MVRDIVDSLLRSNDFRSKSKVPNDMLNKRQKPIFTDLLTYEPHLWTLERNESILLHEDVNK